jgi:WD40 repeat protein
VTHDPDSGKRKEVEVKRPSTCAVSGRYIAVARYKHGMHLFTRDGDLVQIVPDFTSATCATFHPRNRDILAIGWYDGSVRIWDMRQQVYVSIFKACTGCINNILFASDNRLLIVPGNGMIKGLALCILHCMLSFYLKSYRLFPPPQYLRLNLGRPRRMQCGLQQRSTVCTLLLRCRGRCVHLGDV